VNTLTVGEAWVSPALLAELKAREGKDIEVLEGGLTAFTTDTGDLVPFGSSALQAGVGRSPKRQRK
jgi:hypothetical protein